MFTLAKREEYTSDQWKELESEFEKIKYPDDYTCEEVAKEMGLTAEQVNKWFKSRRSRERNRERLDDYMAQSEKKHFISSVRLTKLESEFEKTKYPDISMRKKMAAENRLTEKQVKIWFCNRRDQWKLQVAEETNGDQNEKQKLQQKEDKTETIEQTVDETKQQNLSADQLDILKGAFEERKYPDIFMLEELAREMGITVDRIQVWFQKRRAQHRREEREANAKNEQEKNVCENKQSHVQSTPNAIGFASVGCTSISAVRGRAKCRRLIYHAVTFPVNAVAKLAKKLRSVKCALANKGKNKKE
ncbi:hypothetical protein niasHT_026241 [Heterodera trifolii]|uniref:Homeobox domain-containing protein n=1 Tax=Heterodera trifolii TaxID=157864 RepID=A0ABD2JC47_9BILA